MFLDPFRRRKVPIDSREKLPCLHKRDFFLLENLLATLFATKHTMWYFTHSWYHKRSYINHRSKFTMPNWHIVGIKSSTGSLLRAVSVFNKQCLSMVYLSFISLVRDLVSLFTTSYSDVLRLARLNYVLAGEIMNK